MAGKFSAFDRQDLPYGFVNGHALQATILTPKRCLNEDAQAYPVLVYWHGGGFIVGHRTYEPWWSTWLIDLALSQNAIIITPDYRLLPEATGVQTLDDVESFWIWMHSSLPRIAGSWVARPDLEHILCCGQSCGGRLAVQSALLHPTSRIKGIISISAPLHGNLPHFTVPRPKVIMGSHPPPPRQAEALIRAYIKNIPPGTIVTERDPSLLWELVLCIIQQGRLPRLMGGRSDPRLDIMGLLDVVASMPPVWVIHGMQDSIAPVECSTGFIEKVRGIMPHVPLHVSLREGDHSFEAEAQLNEIWVQEGCMFMLEYWLSGASL